MAEAATAEVLPVETPVVDPAPPEGRSSVEELWGNLDDDFDRVDFEDETPDFSESVEPAVEPPVVEQKVVEPTPEVPPVAETPPVEVQQPPAEVQQPIPQQPIQTIEPPNLEQLGHLRDQFVTQLAQTYAVSPEVANEIDTNFSAVAPHLMAQMHMRIAESITQTIGQMLPTLFTQHMQQANAQQQIADKFYGAWPELQRPEYQQTIGQIVQMYRGAKPGATLDDLVREVGVQAWVAVGLPVQQLLARGQAEVPQQQAPIPQIGGFAPAAPGAPARSQVPTAKNSNVWGQLAEDFLDDDLGD